MIKIGKILKPHGIKGIVKLASFCEIPEDIFNIELFDLNGIIMKCYKAGLTNRQDIFLAKFDCMNSIEDTIKYRNFELFMNKDDLPNTNDNSIYMVDIIGMYVLDDKKHGVVESVSNYGAGDILDIKWDDSKNESILFTKDFIEKIDKKTNTIKIKRILYI